jgi:isopenicillin-N epimerase
MSLRDLFLLRQDIIFLNHGSFGACPRPVFQAYREWQAALERQPVEFLDRRFQSLMREARKALAAFLNVHPDLLVYVPNATTALNTIARSLRLNPGDEVLSTDQEYGALDRVWRFICRKRGARYIRAAMPMPVEEPGQIVAAFRARLTERTKVLFFSHVTSPTAIIFPARELLSLAREAGVLSVVDGAHAPGQIPLDLKALDPDFYAGNCHKWLLAPKGAAFLYARGDRQDLLEPLVVSWGRENHAPGPSRWIDEHEFQGTRDIAAYLSVPAALDFLAAHHGEDVRRRCHDLVRAARRGMTALTGLAPLTPDSPRWFAQMASFPLPPCDGRRLKARLYDEHAIEIPVIPLDGKQVIRVSIQSYNRQPDVDALVRAMEKLLPRVRE